MAAITSIGLTGCLGTGSIAEQAFAPLARVDGAPADNGQSLQAASQQNGIDLVNQSRAENGLGSLNRHPELVARAQRWAEQLAGDQTIYHSQLPGDLDGRVSWAILGENVGMGPTVGLIHDGYLASPTHRANLLSTDYTDIGLGVAESVTGRVFTVQIFMKAR